MQHLIPDPNPPDDDPVEALAKRFDAMAARLRHNADAAFGGAFVVAPPANGGDPIETLIIDSGQSPAQFWAILKTKAEDMIASIEQASRQQGWR